MGIIGFKKVANRATTQVMMKTGTAENSVSGTKLKLMGFIRSCGEDQ